jgi:hypothetical protein
VVPPPLPAAPRPCPCARSATASTQGNTTRAHGCSTKTARQAHALPHHGHPFPPPLARPCTCPCTLSVRTTRHARRRARPMHMPLQHDGGAWCQDGRWGWVVRTQHDGSTTGTLTQLCESFFLFNFIGLMIRLQFAGPIVQQQVTRWMDAYTPMRHARPRPLLQTATPSMTMCPCPRARSVTASVHARQHDVRPWVPPTHARPRAVRLRPIRP